MFDLDNAHRLFRALHITIGFAGLALFWVPAMTRKGSRLHIVSGRLFVGCAWIVGLTGLFASIWGIIHPPSFLSGYSYDSLTADEARLAAENLRFIFSITGFFGLGVLSGLALGVGVMRCGEQHDRLRRSWSFPLSLSFTWWGAALALYGTATLLAAHMGWHFINPSETTRYWLCVGLGAFGFYGGRGDLAYIRAPQAEPAVRSAMHIECMIGAGAAFYSAFLLFGVTRLFALPGYWLLLAIVPMAIGAMATRTMIRRHASPVVSMSPHEPSPS